MLPIALPLRAGVRPILRLFSGLSLFKIEHPHDEAANRGGADALCHLWWARLQGGDKDPLDASSEVFAIDWAIEDPWSVNPVMAQGRHESRGLPGLAVVCVFTCEGDDDWARLREREQADRACYGSLGARRPNGSSRRASLR